MKILFWNTHRNGSINPYILSLVQDNQIDILVTAEYKANKDELNKLLDRVRLGVCNTYGCSRIDIWSNYVNVKPGVQNNYYSIQVIHDKYILCCVHLISDLYGDHSDERLETVQEIMHDIEEIEDKINSRHTIIIGDMNEMPYEKGCLNANGFHGLPALQKNDEPSRKVNGKDYRKFYNPMWNFMGDFIYPPGTYYLNKSAFADVVYAGSGDCE